LSACFSSPLAAKSIQPRAVFRAKLWATTRGAASSRRLKFLCLFCGTLFQLLAQSLYVWEAHTAALGGVSRRLQDDVVEDRSPLPTQLQAATPAPTSIRHAAAWSRRPASALPYIEVAWLIGYLKGRLYQVSEWQALIWYRGFAEFQFNFGIGKLTAALPSCAKKSKPKRRPLTVHSLIRPATPFGWRSRTDLSGSAASLLRRPVAAFGK
jgi:hypothetical protein